MRFIHGEKMTATYFEIDKGAETPMHSHHNEQISNLIKGKFELIVDGESIMMTEGTVVVIPSNIPHKGIAHSDCIVYDFFSPVREDYKQISEK